MHHSIKMGDRGSKKLDGIVSMPNLSIKKSKLAAAYETPTIHYQLIVSQISIQFH